MLSVFDVADYFLAQASDEAGDLMSNLKLQKLVYYAQGLHLALYDEPLFNEPIEAWTHGPVVRALYDRFRSYGAGAIPPPDSLDLGKFDCRTRELLDEVYGVYGQFSAWKLREMTHCEPPWRDTPNLEAISPVKLHDYFLTQLV